MKIKKLSGIKNLGMICKLNFCCLLGRIFRYKKSIGIDEVKVVQRNFRFISKFLVMVRIWYGINFVKIDINGVKM